MVTSSRGLRIDSRRSSRSLEKASRYFQDLGEKIQCDQLGEIDEIRKIHYGGLRLKSVSVLTACINLTVCDLHSNYLTSVQPFENCQKLVYLDLHNNQISHLPGHSFWGQLKNLQVLYLHGNSISKLDCIHDMAPCHNLMIMTLHDTPLALLRDYRHHVVNSVWSLKALDHFIISDEEVIESANFGGRFGAMSKCFQLNLHFPLPVGRSCDEIVKMLDTFVLKVCRIAHTNSPIIIVQRQIRKWLAKRRKLRAEQKNAQSISPSSQKYVEFPTLFVPETSPPVVSSRISPMSVYGTSPTELNLRQLRFVNRLKLSIQLKTKNDRKEMKNVGTRPRYRLAAIRPIRRKPDVAWSFPEVTELENSYVDLHRSVVRAKDGSQRKPKEQKETEKKKKTPPLKKESSDNGGGGDDDERFLSPVRVERSSFPDRATQNREIAKDIREAVKKIDGEVKKRKASKPTIKRSNPRGNDAIMMEKMQTMTLGAVAAVDRAYQRRRMAQQRDKKINAVASERHRREEGRMRSVGKQQFNVQRSATEQRIALRERVVAAQIEMRQQDAVKREQLRIERAGNSLRADARRDDVGFLREFHQQNTTISQALIRHDIQTMRKTAVKAAKERTRHLRLESREQREIVNRFLDHRQLVLSTEGAVAREALNTRMLTEANEALMTARSRVAKAKSQRAAALREANVLFPFQRWDDVKSGDDVESGSGGAGSHSVYFEFPDSSERTSEGKRPPFVRLDDSEYQRRRRDGALTT